MLTTLTVRDETMFGAAADFFFTFELPRERVTARELIETRVSQEVENYNRQQPETFCGLVQPAEAERVLNGFRLPKQKLINAAEQIEKAVAAFERSGFVLLVDDRQVEFLDSVIEIKPQTTVTFLKLVPLVGG